MNNKIKAEVVADSLNLQGDRLTSLLITFPRIILAEVNTHRMLSKNTSSSRAIPFKKMVEAVEKDPFIPIAWQKDHKGMQGSEYFEDFQDIEDLEREWLFARDKAINSAISMNSRNCTKQLVNRLLEPWMWTTMLITGSKEGWDNFFKLRCPEYVVSWYPEDNPEALEPTMASFKSKKQAINMTNGECSFWTEEDWRGVNYSAAEIHIQALAEAIYDAMNESTPKKLNDGEWHIPFRDKINLTPEFVHSIYPNIEDKEQENEYYNSLAIKISTSMAARTSYTTIGDEKEVSLEKHIQLFDKLIKQDPPHSSPLEHVCVTLSDKEYENCGKTKYLKDNSLIIEKGWIANYHGFKSYRFIIDNKYGRN